MIIAEINTKHCTNTGRHTMPACLGYWAIGLLGYWAIGLYYDNRRNRRRVALAAISHTSLANKVAHPTSIFFHFLPFYYTEQNMFWREQRTCLNSGLLKLTEACSSTHTGPGGEHSRWS